MKEFKKYQYIQKIAKEVLQEITLSITCDSTEETIVDDCISLLKSKGITKTWYHNTPALVLLGSRSCLSVSGKDYIPGNEKVGATNLITIDLSPLDDDIWGDCARSIIIEDGKCISELLPIEYKNGIEAEIKLHEILKSYVDINTTFEGLYFHINNFMEKKGIINLDFMGNLGHSIEKRIEERIYIEKENNKKLSSIEFFTFEPHIRLKNGKWGFKHENIYYFKKNGKLSEL